MTVELVFITYNRLSYTKLALASVLQDPGEEFCLTIWDNASTDGTREFLREEVRDPRVQRLVLSERNVGQVAAVNEVWSSSKADLLGKLDNDCLLPPGWSRTLAQAHADIPSLGVVACWPFFEDDFNYERAKHKIQTFGLHQILRHPWTCGTGLLLKREHVQHFGPLAGQGTTEYWMRMARHGLINGYYYPLLFQEHMDDPKSRHCQTASREGFEAAKAVTVSLRAQRYSNPEGRLAWREKIIANLLDAPYDPRWYRGWRDRWRRLRGSLRRWSAKRRRLVQPSRS